MRKSALLAAAVTLAASTALNAAVVDGTRDAAYNAALAVQANATGFGDNSNTDGATANGSELDAAYAQISGGRLYLFFAGNLETNFNHLNVYFDTNAAGSTSVTNNGGTTFDTGFTADRRIDINGDAVGLYTDFTNFNDGTGSFVGRFAPNGTRVSGDGGSGVPDVQVAFNNSNVAGVTGATADAAAAQAVTTGIEISIPLADLGIDGSSIRVLALVNGGGNGFASNQTLGTLASGTANLGNGPIDFNAQAGNQFFTVTGVPEPASLALFGLGAAGLLRRRK